MDMCIAWGLLCWISTSRGMSFIDQHPTSSLLNNCTNALGILPTWYFLALHFLMPPQVVLRFIMGGPILSRALHTLRQMSWSNMLRRIQKSDAQRLPTCRVFQGLGGETTAGVKIKERRRPYAVDCHRMVGSNQEYCSISTNKGGKLT